MPILVANLNAVTINSDAIESSSESTIESAIESAIESDSDSESSDDMCLKSYRIL